jgi:hypothetical protein
MLHVARRQKLALLDVHRLAGRRAGVDEIRLAAQEGRRLQHVDVLGDDGRFFGGMHVGQHRHAELALHVGQYFQALLHAGAAKTGARTAVGLVERRLVDERYAEARSDFLQLPGGIERHVARLDDARPGDQEKRSVESDIETTQLHADLLRTRLFAGQGFAVPRPSCRARAAREKAVNSGCPARGVDVNSGWNWQATNQG